MMIRISISIQDRIKGLPLQILQTCVKSENNRHSIGRGLHSLGVLLVVKMKLEQKWLAETKDVCLSKSHLRLDL